MGNSTISVTDQTFQEKVLKSSVPVLVDFWAPWCGPCVAIGPTLDQLAQEFDGKVTVAKMNVDENSQVPASFGVRSIPFLVMIKDGQVVDTAVGAQPKAALKNLIEKAL
jgi:thioredoxin 1